MRKRGTILKHLNFLPGRLILREGTRADYAALERFHYIAGRPATFAAIWTIHHQQLDELLGQLQSHPIAIAILSYPCLNSSARELALNLHHLSRKRSQNFVNQNIRTISRIIIHPTYRGLGLARILIQSILKNPPTRFTEALATMAKAHPLFKKSGMQEFPSFGDDKPTYYLFDRDPSRGTGASPESLPGKTDGGSTSRPHSGQMVGEPRRS